MIEFMAIPTGFEPVTIGLEGPQQTAHFCGFSASQTVNGTRQFVEETHASVNGDDDG